MGTASNTESDVCLLRRLRYKLIALYETEPKESDFPVNERHRFVVAQRIYRAKVRSLLQEQERLEQREKARLEPIRARQIAKEARKRAKSQGK